MQSNSKVDTLCVNSIRTLAADAIQKAKSGHPGTPIGAAAVGYTLFNRMRINPKNPNWLGRDRFVLSAGHASMLLYSLLHINGYDVSIDDIKNFRQLNSKTPGHPEREMTPGVDANTGPLGQGFAMAVGMAMAQAHLASVFNKPEFPIVDNNIFVFMGDGCMMEGAASEAASLAGTLKLNKLIAIYDRNNITIEGSTDIAFTEDVGARFKAYGFNVLNVSDGEDVAAIGKAIDDAKASDRPTLIIVDTVIGYGTKKANMTSAHGEPLGAENIADMKAQMGWNYDEFTVPQEVYDYYDTLNKERASLENEYDAMLSEYKKSYPELAKKWEDWHNATPDAEKLLALADKTPDGKMATRSVSGEILNRLYSEVGIENLFGGSADLGPSNKTVIKGSGFFAPGEYENINIHFGIRELAMATICNGMMLYGGVRAFCATFMVFSDYVKPALRLSALMGLPVMYVFTHDSIGVGEDGPTHHPIEQLSMLRAIPNVNVFRPADYRETVAAYTSALTGNKPTAIVLSRQDLPQYDGTGACALRGGYVIADCNKTPDVIIIATGSEVEIAMEAYAELTKQGKAVRVVSMPCTQLFDEQTEEYRESVLPSNVKARVVVEAGCSFGWHKYAGDNGKIIAIDRFGLSAPAKVLFKEFGFTKEAVIDAACAVIK